MNKFKNLKGQVNTIQGYVPDNGSRACAFAINANANVLVQVIERLEKLEELMKAKPCENAANPDAPEEKPERLTIREWRNLDPWETCGDLTATCNRGNCRGCLVPKLYAKLAKFEDEQEGAKE